VQIGTSVPDPLTVETSPREVTVVVERILQRTVPVEVIWDPPKEGVTRHPFAQPDRVRVTGVQSAVERVVRVVARFDRTGPDLQMVGLKPVDANGKVVTGVVCSPSQVTVSVGLPPTRASFSAPVSVQTTGRLPDGYELGSVQATPREVTIVAAEEAVLREVRAISTAPVALNGITATTSRTVDLVLPSGVTAPGVATVTVLIEVRRTAAPEDPAAGGATPGG
jgi:YbbR domain-containing protein